MPGFLVASDIVVGLDEKAVDFRLTWGTSYCLFEMRYSGFRLLEGKQVDLAQAEVYLQGELLVQSQCLLVGL